MTDDEKSPPAPPAPSHKDEKSPPTPDLTELTRQGMEKMQTALSNYLSSFASAAKGEVESGNEVTSAFAKYAGRNVANAVAFAQKLVQVKDVQDLVKVQTEFVKSQMEAVAEQAAAVRETAEKASAERLEHDRGFGGASFWGSRQGAPLAAQATADVARPNGARLSGERVRRASR